MDWIYSPSDENTKVGKCKNMNPLNNSLRMKRGPGGKLRELSHAGLGQRLGHPALNRRNNGSTPLACTMKHSTAAVGVVVMPAHPCGEQQAITRVWQKGDAPDLHSGNGGSTPSTRTNRMCSAASESRQLSHAGVVQVVERMNHNHDVAGSSPAFGTEVRRRQTLSVSFAHLAQRIERRASNSTAEGSIPSVGAMNNVRIQSYRIRYVRLAQLVRAFDL